MKKRILALAGVLALVAVLAVPMTALATNTGTQNASTSQADTITIVSKAAGYDVASITFPAGLPSATVSTPYNNVDTSADPQVLAASDSEPVVQLKNGSAGTLKIWLGITAWTNSAVASERYKLVDPDTTNVLSLTEATALTTTSTDTTITIAAAAYKALYLEVTLGALTGKTGTSTLTVLGES